MVFLIVELFNQPGVNTKTYRTSIHKTNLRDHILDNIDHTTYNGEAFVVAPYRLILQDQACGYTKRESHPKERLQPQG